MKQSSIDNDLALSCITTIREATALHREWASLWRTAPSATPFNTPEWLLAWWRAFGNSCLRLFVVRKGGRLVGLLPAYLLDGRLQLLGIGSSDYLDLLAEPELEHHVARAVLQAATSDESWREVEFQNLAASSPLLRHAVTPHWQERRFVLDVCPALPLPRDVSGLQKVIPTGQYKNYSYNRRRMERETQFALEPSSASASAEACEALFRLHTAQWNKRGMPGVLTGSTATLLKEALPPLAATGIARLSVARSRGEIIGVLLGFSTRQRFSYYLSGVSPDFRKYGIGTLLVGYALEQAVESGHHLFDFLRGGESYKYAWGAVDQPLWSRSFTAQQTHSENDFSL